MSLELRSRTHGEARPTLRGRAGPAAGTLCTSGGGWRRGGVLAAAAVFLSIGGLALSRAVAPGGASGRLTCTVARGDLDVSIIEEGTLESSSNREIKCKVKGGTTVLWVVEAGTQIRPGDVLVRLDTSAIEDSINEQRIAFETAQAAKAAAESEAAVAQINVTEYQEGIFRSEQNTKEKDLVIAESQLKAARNALEFSRRMFRKGFTSSLDVECREDDVKHAELEVKVKQTDLDVLNQFTRPKKLQELEGALESARAKLASAMAALELERTRLQRAEQQLENCVIRAEVEGLVMFPSVAEWQEQPDIQPGATVREDQVLLIVPDLAQMQVKVGVHESRVDRLRTGMPARIRQQDREFDGEVASIATMTRPTGWWTGNLVKYDTIVKLSQPQGLKPGMSVAAEIFVARYTGVLMVPVAAVVDEGGEHWCWVESAQGPERRRLTLGDTNDQFLIVEAGLKEGERVVLNPLDEVEEARRVAQSAATRQPPAGPGRDSAATSTAGAR